MAASVEGSDVKKPDRKEKGKVCFALCLGGLSWEAEGGVGGVRLSFLPRLCAPIVPICRPKIGSCSICYSSEGSHVSQSGASEKISSPIVSPMMRHRISNRRLAINIRSPYYLLTGGDKDPLHYCSIRIG